jgi:nucleoside-diphosphate-sugar epimerase
MPMAKNLCQAGLEVVGHDREEDRADEFRELGARWASSAAKAVERAHVVATDAARLAPRSSRSWQDRPEPLGRPNLAPS